MTGSWAKHVHGSLDGKPIDWLIDWLIGVTARQHKIGQFVSIYQGGLLAQAFENNQRGAYKNITVAGDTMNIHMQRQTTGMPYLLKEKQCIQQITWPRIGKKRKPACNTFSSRWHNYISKCTAIIRACRLWLVMSLCCNQRQPIKHVHRLYACS